MFYISRCIGKDKWGVVDTDDYVETPCTLNQIKDAVLIHGIKIEGVSLVHSRFSGWCVESVTVYQNPAFSSRIQAKTAALLGVVVTTSGTDIVSITVPSTLSQNTVKLRLSEYGKSCSGHILQNIKVDIGKQLILVLDDNITVTAKTFSSIADCIGVFIDIHDVKNEKTLQKVYNCDGFRGGYNRVDLYIFDFPERLDFYKGVVFLNKGPGDSSSQGDIMKSFRSFEEVSQKLGEHFKSSFKKLADSEFMVRGKIDPFYSTYFASRRSLSTIRSSYEANMLTFDIARANSEDLVWSMRTLSNVNRTVLMQFERYIRWFDPIPEVRALFVRFSVRSVQWIDAVCKALRG